MSIPIVFSKKYTVPSYGHVFKAGKFEAALKLLLKEKIIKFSDIVEPQRPSKEDLELAHAASWVKKILSGKFTAADAAKAELRITKEVIEAHLMNVGGTIMAAFLALEDGIGINCGGGAHHAFADHGEGFCMLNDIAVAVKKLLKGKFVKRVMIIDLDAHQGNGTAAIFRGDRQVFTFSMHGAATYPEKKEKSSADIELRPGTGDAVYLAALRRSLPGAMDKFRPDFAVYVAGADVYKRDLLGGLGLTIGGIKKRDAFVFGECRVRRVPAALVLSGGYAKKFSDTVRIHANTIHAGLNSI